MLTKVHDKFSRFSSPNHGPWPKILILKRFLLNVPVRKRRISKCEKRYLCPSMRGAGKAFACEAW